MQRYLLILLTLVVIGGLMGGALFLYVKSQEYQDKIDTLQADLNSEKNKVLPAAPIDISEVASKYDSYTYLTKCDLAMAIPDNSVVFPDANQIVRTWNLQSNKAVAPNNFNSYPFTNADHYWVTLLGAQDASGYIPGLVDVTCIKRNSTVSLEKFVNDYIAAINSYNKDLANRLDEKLPSTFVSKNMGAETKWGVETYKVELRFFSPADTYTLKGNIFFAGDKVYEVVSTSASAKKTELDSMAGIVNSITIFKK